MRRKIVVMILFILLIFSLSINFVFYKADIEFYVKAKHYMNKELIINTKSYSYTDIHNEVLEGTLKFIRDGKREEFPSTMMLFTERFRQAYTPKTEYPRFFWAEPAWALVAVLEDPLIKGNRDLIKELSQIFDETTIDNEFINVDQSVSSIAALRLYELTKDQKYMLYANRMYSWLKSLDTEYGILYNNNPNVSIVDCLGMVVPFLMEYSKYCDSTEAKKLAMKTMECYIDKGVDSDTGFPAFSYRLKEPHIKMGMSNWGRGISYYTIGLNSIIQEDINDSVKIRITMFNKNICALWNDKHCFGQFVGEGEKKDLSAELPIIYYLFKSNLLHITKNDILEYGKFLHDGIMYNSSSSNSGIIRYGTNIGPNILAQAFMLKLLNEVK